ncbi:hypothetical protein DL98DRAFT_538717 [Cadophora sp. DSE1049]|nr:hypothetical protein DL98DRAFT_538717 [Cadophora sp. DSE1049]
MASSHPDPPEIPPPNSTSLSPESTASTNESLPPLLTIPSSATNSPTSGVASSYHTIQHSDVSRVVKSSQHAEMASPSNGSSSSPASKFIFSPPRIGNLHKDKGATSSGSSSHLADALVDMPEIQLEKVAKKIPGPDSTMSVNEPPSPTHPATSLPTAPKWLAATKGIGGTSHIETSAPPMGRPSDNEESSRSGNTQSAQIAGQPAAGDHDENPSSTPVPNSSGKGKNKNIHSPPASASTQTTKVARTEQTPTVFQAKVRGTRGMTRRVKKPKVRPRYESEDDDDDHIGVKRRGGWGSPHREIIDDAMSDLSSDTDIDPTPNTLTFFNASAHLHANSAGLIVKLSKRISALEASKKSMKYQLKKALTRVEEYRDVIEGKEEELVEARRVVEC